MTTHAHVRAIMLMAVSSFCSHQCSGHSICPTKHALHVCEREKRFCPSATLEISKEYWGVKQSPFCQNWMFDLLPGVRNYPPLVTKQGIDRMGHYTGCNAAGTQCSEDVCRTTWSYLFWMPEKSIVLVCAGQSTTGEVLSTCSTT